MNKINEIEKLISNLDRWRSNRNRINGHDNRKGRELNSDPLFDSIKFLTEYKELLSK